MLRSEDEQARGWLRRSLVPEVVYEAMPRSGTHEYQDADTHVTTLTFMAGYHFPKHARAWGDLNKPARDVLAVTLNGYKHLAPSGKRLSPKAAAAGGPLRLASVPLQWHTDVAVEIVPSAPDERKRVYCAGYKVHFIGHEQGGGDEVPEEPEPDAPVGAPRRAPARTRENAKTKALKALRQDARDAPLAVGLAKSFAEAAELRATVRKQREDYVKNNLRRGSDVAVLEARDRIREGPSVPEYGFSAYTNMDEFLFHAVQPYFNKISPRCRAHPTHDPGNQFLRFYEGCDELARANDEISGATRHKLLVEDDYYVHTESPVHPDHMFTLARSLAYFVRDGEYRADQRCTQLERYIPRATGQPVPVARRNDPPTDSHEDEDSDDDDDDDDEEEEEESAPDPLDVDLRRYLSPAGTPLYHDVARGTYPYPGLVFKVNPIATYAEVFTTIIPLVYPIGTEIPQSALQHREQGDTNFLPEQSPLEVTRCLMAAERLRVIEEAELEAAEAAEADTDEEDNGEVNFTMNRRKLPAKMKAMVMVRGRDGAMHKHAVTGVQVEDMPDPTQNAGAALDRQLEAERQERRRQMPPEKELQLLEEAGANGVPKQYVPVLQHHKAVVRRAVNELAARFRGMLYDELFKVRWQQRSDAFTSHAHMPASEFYPPVEVTENNLNEGLQGLRKMLAREHHKTGFTPADERIVLDSVSLHPTWLLEREEPLELRREIQLTRATTAHKHAKEREALLNDPQFANDAVGLRVALLELAEKQAKKVDEELAKMHRRGWEVYMETERLAPALKAVRNYTKSEVLPNGDKPHVKRPVTVSMRGYVAFRQHYLDTYRTATLATKANCPFMERVHTCAYHAFRWMVNRKDPALNYVMTGESGAGKSHALLEGTVSMFPEGMVSDMASETTNSYNVDQNFDGYIVLYQELPNDLLFSNGPEGPTDKTNFAKARMTSFHTKTRYFTQNEQTGKREASISNSSQHIVTMGATNQDLAKMDKNMRRRLMVDIFVEAPTESEGANPAEMTRPDPESAEAYKVSDHATSEQRELAAGYAYVECLMKMGIIDDVISDNANNFLNHILQKAAPIIGSAAKNKGYRVWVLEAARILTIQHAVYNTLFGLAAHARYAAGKLKRWTPAAFQYICQPQLGIFKDAVIHAITMLDFLYSSETENRLLATIALELMHVAEPQRWRFRVKSDRSIDYNYLTFAAPSMAKIYGTIVTRHASTAVIRSEDIPVMLRKHLTKKNASRGFEGVEVDAATNQQRLIRALPGSGAPIEERNVFITEDDPESTAKSPPKVFCMSIEFMEKLFGIDVTRDTPDTIREVIGRKEPHIDAAKLRTEDPTATLAELRELLVCTKARAPLVSAIQEALRMPTLERSPYEHDELLPLRKELLSYWTSYLPPDMYVDFDGKEPKRVPVDGVAMFIEGQRAADGEYIMQVNYTKPLPTALSTLYGIHEGEDNPRMSNLPEMSRGFICDLYDVDYFTSIAAMTRMGHQGDLLMHELYLKACVHFRDHAKYPDGERYRRQLLKAIPELDPAGGVPLPFAFPPIAYLIDRYLLLVENSWREPVRNYPASNVFDRLQHAVLTTDARATGNANGAFKKLSERYNIEDRRFYMELKLKRAREAALAAPPPVVDAGEEEERPAKRARPEYDEEEEDAMDIDEPAPAAARLARHMPPRARVESSVEEEEEDDDDMFTD